MLGSGEVHLGPALLLLWFVFAINERGSQPLPSPKVPSLVLCRALQPHSTATCGSGGQEPPGDVALRDASNGQCWW